MEPSKEHITPLAELLQAASKGNILRIRELVLAGTSSHPSISYATEVLRDVVEWVSADKDPNRCDVVRTLLELGADPNYMEEDCSGPLVPAMINMDGEMIALLLKAGADPNDPRLSGDDPPSFYDWAEFDYRFYLYDLREPEEATQEDRKDENSWLRYLDRMAIRHDKPRPGYLFLLREYGAKTAPELRGESGSSDQADAGSP